MDLDDLEPKKKAKAYELGQDLEIGRASCRERV